MWDCESSRETMAGLQPIVNEFFEVPIVTRFYISSCVLTTLAVVSFLHDFFYNSLFDFHEFCVWVKFGPRHSCITSVICFVFVAIGYHHSISTVFQSYFDNLSVSDMAIIYDFLVFRDHGFQFLLQHDFRV